VIVPGDREPSPGVMQLLGELSARGVTIRRLSGGCWWRAERRKPRLSISGSYS